jgi:hypothetical protein
MVLVEGLDLGGLGSSQGILQHKTQTYLILISRHSLTDLATVSHHLQQEACCLKKIKQQASSTSFGACTAHLNLSGAANGGKIIRSNNASSPVNVHNRFRIK